MEKWFLRPLTVCTLLHRFSEMHKVVPFILDPHQSRKQIHCCKICCNTSPENCAKGAFKLNIFRTLRNIKETRNAFHPKTITHLILKTISRKRFVIQDSTFPGKVVFISPYMWWTCECDNCKNSTRWGRRRLSGGLHSWGIAFCCTYAPSTMSCLIGATILSDRGAERGRQLPKARKTTDAILLHVNPLRNSWNGGDCTAVL